MKNKDKFVLVLFGLILGVIIGFFVTTTLKHDKSVVKEEPKISQTSTDKDKKEATSEKQRLQEVEEAYIELKKQKQDDVLPEATSVINHIFEVYYTYDQKEVTNKERQEKVSDKVIKDVGEKLFPESADGLTSDYGFIKSKLNSVDVYYQNTVGSTLTAWVDISYTVNAGSVTNTIPHYEFKVTYDAQQKKLTAVEEIGVIK